MAERGKVLVPEMRLDAEAWKQSSMALWEHSSMALWEHSSMALWEHSSMALWEHSSMALWEHSSMALWEHSSMALWEHHATVLWRDEALEPFRGVLPDTLDDDKLSIADLPNRGGESARAMATTSGIIQQSQKGGRSSQTSDKDRSAKESIEPAITRSAQSITPDDEDSYKPPLTKVASLLNGRYNAVTPAKVSYESEWWAEDHQSQIYPQLFILDLAMQWLLQNTLLPNSDFSVNESELCPQFPTKVTSFHRVLIIAELFQTIRDSPLCTTGSAQILSTFMTCHHALYQVLKLAGLSQAARLINSHFSIMVLDPNRDGVVKLVEITIAHLEELADEFTIALVRLASRVRRYTREGLGWSIWSRVPAIFMSLKPLIARCMSSLEHIDPGIASYCSARIPDLWDAILLKVATLLYLGICSHLQGHIHSVQNFPLDTLSHVLPPLIKTSVRSLGCLDRFLQGRKVHVIHAPSTTPKNFLCVSAHVATLSGIWGPVHATCIGDGRILALSLGSGWVVPWRNSISEQITRKDEIFCHWLPSDALEAVEAHVDTSAGRRLPFQSFSPDSFPPHSGQKLLIGARGGSPLLWRRCNCDAQEVKLGLKLDGRAHDLFTSSSYTRVRPQNLGLTVGHYINSNLTFNIETVDGNSRKQGLMNTWEIPSLRNIHQWEEFSGILVSFCTWNAQRVRLIDLLVTPTVVNVLKGVVWKSKDAKKAFNEVLDCVGENPFALGSLWTEKPEYQEEIGEVLLTCLQHLCRSGFDTVRKQYNVFWYHEGERLRITLDPAKHNWVNFLKESEDSLSMAVLVEDCLVTRRECGYGRTRCSSRFNDPNSFSLLETTIRPRPEHPGISRVRDYVNQSWDHVILESAINTTLSVGSQGVLRILEKVGKNHLLTRWQRRKLERLYTFWGLDLTHGAQTRDHMLSHPSLEDFPRRASPNMVRPILTHIT